jgi:hypothetical protein
LLLQGLKLPAAVVGKIILHWAKSRPLADSAGVARECRSAASSADPMSLSGRTHHARATQADSVSQVGRLSLVKRMAKEAEKPPMFADFDLRGKRIQGGIRPNANEVSNLLLGLFGFHHRHDLPSALLVKDDAHVTVGDGTDLDQTDIAGAYPVCDRAHRAHGIALFAQTRASGAMRIRPAGTVAAARAMSP